MRTVSQWKGLKEVGRALRKYVLSIHNLCRGHKPVSVPGVTAESVWIKYLILMQFSSACHLLFPFPDWHTLRTC